MQKINREGARRIRATKWRGAQEVGRSRTRDAQEADASSRRWHVDLFLILLVSTCCASSVIAFSPQTPPHSRTLRTLMRESIAPRKVSQNEQSSSEKTHLVFPGGGIFFYWQAGVVCYLREQGYDLDDTTMAGASAGALTATLTAANVDFYDSTSLALEIAEEEGVWDRRGGLQGVWGPMIERWLEEMLPGNVVNLVNGRLSLLVTPVPSFGKSRVSMFADKNDLIRCNMASVHLPLFLDSKFTSLFRERPHIDGSFLATTKDYLPDGKEPKSVIVMDWQSDPAMKGGALEFVSTISKDAVWGLLEKGKSFAETMENRGDFQSLELTSRKS